jgi:hypothetical protein
MPLKCLSSLIGTILLSSSYWINSNHIVEAATLISGNREHHEFELVLALEDIDHAKTRAQSPQSNGICERFHKTILNEFYQVAFRKKLYRSIEELQTDVDQGIEYYNKQRHHSGKYGFVKTPRQTFLDSIQLAKGKVID